MPTYTTANSTHQCVFPDLISLALIKDQCRVAHNDDDVRMNRLKIQCQKIVIDYCKRADTYFDYTPNTSPVVGVPLPAHIQASMLLVAENLYNSDPPISDAVKLLLERSRDPTLV